MTCTVSGNIIDIQAQPKSGAALMFQPSQSNLGRSGGSGVVPGPVSVSTDANGDFSVALLPGSYTVSITKGGYASAQIVVPDAATANLPDIMDLTPPPALPDAEAAEQAAQGYAAAAHSAANAPRDQALAGGGFSARHYRDETQDLANDVSGQAATVNTKHGEVISAAGTVAGQAATVNTKHGEVISAAGTVAGQAATVNTQHGQVIAAAGQVAADRSAVAAIYTAVAQIFDDLDDRFLGVFNSDPAEDNDGDPLERGAVYVWVDDLDNPTQSETRFFDGMTWEGPEGAATQAAGLAQRSRGGACVCRSGRRRSCDKCTAV